MKTEIVTSYFAQAKNLRKEGYRVISIARFESKYQRADTGLIDLAPTADMIHMEDWEQYQIRYGKILLKADWKLITNILLQYSKNALCCHEKDREHCHRKLAGEFIAKQTGLEIKEFVPIGYIDPKKKVVKNNDNPKLF